MAPPTTMAPHATARHRPTVIEVDLSAIRRNVARLAGITSTTVCAVVKADGYGHGAVQVATAALDGGASWLAVALVEEGEQLRAAGIDAPVLVLTEPPVDAIGALLDARLTPTIYSPRFIDALDAAGAQRGHRVSAHLKVDTGMGRVGVVEADWPVRLDQLAATPHVEVAGIQTHLARADEPAAPTTAEQLARFARFLALARAEGFDPPFVHAANTAGALVHPESRHTMVRTGIGIYGLSPSEAVDAADHGLKPAMRLRSEVSFAKRVDAGTGVSYGHRWHAPVDGWVATVPIGYADGVRRALSNHAEVLLAGARRPVVGSVCMDQLLVWCDQDEVRVGDEVVLLGAATDGGDAPSAGDAVRAEEWAESIGSITYEVVTGFTARVPRMYRDER